MSKAWMIRCATTWAILALSCPPLGAAERLTPRELVSLMEAGRDRHESLTADMKLSLRHLQDGKPDDSPFEVEDITWRWTPDRSYTHARRFALSDTSSRGSVELAPVGEEYQVTTREYGKTLEMPANASRPRAVISPRPARVEPSHRSLRDLIWYPHGVGFINAILQDPSASVRTEQGLYVLEGVFSETGGVRGRVTVDPAKGYLPVASGIFKRDGTCPFASRCEGLHEVSSGVWLPTKIVALSGGVQSEYEITRASVNVNISNADLDVVFPSGTVVDDRIANLRYVVDEESEGVRIGDQAMASMTMPATTRAVTEENLQSASPASNEELARAAPRATSSPAARHSGTRGVWVWACAAAVVVIILVLVWAVSAHRAKARQRPSQTDM